LIGIKETRDTFIVKTNVDKSEGVIREFLECVGQHLNISKEEMDVIKGICNHNRLIFEQDVDFNRKHLQYIMDQGIKGPFSMRMKLHESGLHS
jgi:hypothetical protein